MTNPQKILSQYFGHQSFRAPQEAIIESILAGQQTLALLPTGQGKSICYQLPGLMLGGLTLVISPLIALMKDQVDALHKKGLTAHYLNSSLTRTEVKAKYQNLKLGQCQFLYVAPERLLTKSFLALMKVRPPQLIAVDEAHCFSTWGHDFRPHYRDITSFIGQLPTQPKLALFTATASRKVVTDLQQSFGIRPQQTFRGSFFRQNLFIATRSFRLRSQRFLYLVYLIKHVFPDQAGLIYVATRKEAESLCQAVKKICFDQKLAIDYYHAGRSQLEKTTIQEKFLNDDLKIIIATNAFGMGIDKANIRFVIHFQLPGSLENYVQEIGRAGRDNQFSWCELLFHPSDLEIHQRLTSRAKSNHHQRSLPIMLAYLLEKTCHHQKILTYFQDSHYFKNGCARCEHCSPYGQPFLRHLQQAVTQWPNLPTFVAQQQLIVANHQPKKFNKLIGVGLGMVQ